MAQMPCPDVYFSEQELAGSKQKRATDKGTRPEHRNVIDQDIDDVVNQFLRLRRRCALRPERIIVSAFGVDDDSSRRLASVSIFVSSSIEGLPIQDVAKGRQNGRALDRIG